MRPILFHYGNFYVMSYGVMVTLAYVLAVAYVRSHRGRMGLKDDDFWNLMLAIIAGALIGGRIGALAFYFRGEWKGLWTVFAAGGFSFYHGFWGSVLAGLAYCRAAGLAPWGLADFCVPALAIGHAVGRFGCFLAGCCHGRPTELPWGVVFKSLPSDAASLRGLALHPTQLYELGGNLLIAFFLHLQLVSGKAKPGQVFWLYVLCYALLRFITDPFRGVDPGRAAWHFSTAQWVAVFSAAVAAGFLARLRARPAPVSS